MGELKACALCKRTDCKLADGPDCTVYQLGLMHKINDDQRMSIFRKDGILREAVRYLYGHQTNLKNKCGDSTDGLDAIIARITMEVGDE